MKILQMTLEEIYLDWVNNFISVEGFAQYYGISRAKAENLIMTVQLLNN